MLLNHYLTHYLLLHQQFVHLEPLHLPEPPHCLHRLLAHLPAIRTADAVIVCAGMEGALPSVVGGLVAVPVIAVPTSVGYGASFGGVTAMLGMLNSCSPNVTVVNIDNGFGAGYVSTLYANRAVR